MDQNSANGFSFLLEIGAEDLPARFLPLAIKQLKENTGKILKDNHVRFFDIRTYGTPRRLAVIADGVPQMQEDRTIKVFGPSKKAAFDERGNPTKAALGFANSQDISVESLVIKSKDKGEYVVAEIDEKGVPVAEVLPEIFKSIVLSLHFPKAMRWGNNNLKFVRPIRWLLALFDKEIISFEIDGIKSGNRTMGHRFLSPAGFQIKEIPSYKKLLNNNFVIIDAEERKRIIAEKMEKLLASTGERPIKDEDLLETVVNLVEYPVPVVAAFPEQYLELPKELLITVMKGHQKYFAAEDANGKITNHFVVVSNTSQENADTVKIGAERVIKARFEDARFYFDEDRKKPLSDRIEELKKVTFQENLGSLYEKMLRVASIAEVLAGRINPEVKANLVRAARLAKTDLITGVVREFPELQGVMGGYYALHDGEGNEVAKAIEEQYLPAYSGGDLPGTDAGALLSIADKIDSIAAFFSIGLMPTGSEDPFALRRQSLGVIAIILDKGYEISLRTLVEKALESLSGTKNPEGTKNQILQFFRARIETVFASQGHAPDLIEAVLPLSHDVFLKDLLQRLDALKQFKEHAGYNDFITAMKRVNNIIPKGAVPVLKRELLMEEPEKKLKEALDSVDAKFNPLLENVGYQPAVELLLSLTDPINHFFDSVLVMDKREEIKLNRLALLNEIWKTVSVFADLSKLSAIEKS